MRWLVYAVVVGTNIFNLSYDLMRIVTVVQQASVVGPAILFLVEVSGKL